MRKKRTVHVMSKSAIAGVDLGVDGSLVAVLCPRGEVEDRFSFSMNSQGYALFAGRVSRDARVAFEATLMAYLFSRTLKELGYTDITVAHPVELAWVVRSKKKNDRADSLKIAKLHLAGLLPESHLLDREEQIERDPLIQRVKLGVEIGRVKSSITSYLVREVIVESLPETHDSFSAARRVAIGSVRFGDDRDLVLRTMLERLELIEKQCEPLEERIRRNARESKYVRLIMSIRGVDYYLASLYASCIGDPIASRRSTTW
jgi:transposase